MVSNHLSLNKQPYRKKEISCYTSFSPMLFSFQRKIQILLDIFLANEDLQGNL
jgi:hypothetical protein